MIVNSLILQQDALVIRKFNETDIPNKIKWINDPANNQYLHYDLPLEFNKTQQWFHAICDIVTRYDAVIEYENTPIGLIGLLNIDSKNLKTELYICMGEKEYTRKGIAKKACKLLIQHVFKTLKLNKIYLYTEEENIRAQKLFESVGMKKEGLVVEDIISNGRIINRYIYGITKNDYEKTFPHNYS